MICPKCGSKNIAIEKYIEKGNPFFRIKIKCKDCNQLLN